MNFSILIFFTALKNPLEYDCSRGIMLVKYLYARSAALIKLCSLEVYIGQLCKIQAWAKIIHKRFFKSVDPCEGEKIMHSDFPYIVIFTAKSLVNRNFSLLRQNSCVDKKSFHSKLHKNSPDVYSHPRKSFSTQICAHQRSKQKHLIFPTFS